jgi:hypothetical protein
MKRLRDQGGDDPAQRRGVEILQRAPATPRMPDMKRRVWHSLHRDPARHAAGLARRRLKLAAAAVAVLALAGTAAAMIRGPLPGRLAGLWRAPAVDANAPVGRKGATPRREPAPAPPAEAPRVMPPATVTLPPAATEPTAPRRSPPPSRGAVAARGAAVAVTATATARERTEVLDALVALRRDHDPVRAAAMLSAYLSSHPRGALREEALALAIEAADARGDRTAGERLSRSYVEAYPSGRFVGFARGHLP